MIRPLPLLLAGCQAGALWGDDGAIGSGAAMRPLHAVSPGKPERIVPGRWQLYDNIDELSATELEPLCRALTAEAEFGRTAPPLPREAATRPAHPAFEAIRGTGPAMCEVLQRAVRYAPSALAMLIRGPTGTGKELFARAVHEASGRAGRYVAIDLSAQAESLVESALFGHVEGAFTGAERERLGAFREANGGTLFLDELGNLSPGVQARLLRALETRMVQPLGSDRVYQTDVRLVAATNAGLEDMVRRGEFREDLLYRFNPAATLWLPPLRERREDVLELAEGFAATARGRPVRGQWMTPAAAEALQSWAWPGNVRELRHVIEAATVEAGDGRIDVEHLSYVSPRERVAAARIVTTTDISPEPGADWKVPRPVRLALTAVTVRVPRMADRGPLSVRNAVLSGLEGRPITAEALDVLSVRPWWGELTELDRVIAALRAIPGMIDRRAVQAVLPELSETSPLAPLLVLMHPTRDWRGHLGGLRQAFPEGALLIGRTRRFSDLDTSQGADPRARERARTLANLLGPVRPGLMCFDHVPALSRAHALVVREEGSLVVHLLPGAKLPTYAGPLGGAFDHRVTPDGPVDIGNAGAIEVRGSGGGLPVLKLYVFAGEVAFAESSDLVPVGGQAGVTRSEGDSVDDGPHRVWTLTATERLALTQLVGRLLERGGAFAQWVREGAAAMGSAPELRTLGRYLASGHPGQSCVRLYAHEANVLLRGDLQAILQAMPNPADAWSKLPKGIRETVERPG